MATTSNDTSHLVQRLARLEVMVNQSRRFGTVQQVDLENGYRIRWGDKVTGNEAWTGEGDWLSPWIPFGQQAGFSAEFIPLEVGQQVLVQALNEDATQALIQPYTWSEHQPRDPDAKLDRHSQRIRKPLTEGQSAELDAHFKGTDYPKKEDSDDDMRFWREHNLFKVQIGKTVLELTKDSATITVGKAKLKLTDGEVELKLGGTGVVIGNGSVRWSK